MKLGGGKWKETIMSAGVMDVPDLRAILERFLTPTWIWVATPIKAHPIHAWPTPADS